ncbi:hypothetical protein M1349_01805 [Patescibacteria group bacterium]|nr:hypothetical protein [Patescibacteria group bacterium]
MQPNDLVLEPIVSSNPADRLPEETRGQIQQICKDPVIEEKRKLRHREVMQHNTNALKTGEFSKNHPVPEFIYAYFNFLDELQLKETEEVREAMVKLVIDNFKRIELSKHVEIAKGGEQDTNLSRLIKETFYMLNVLLFPNGLPNLIGNQMNTQINLGTINQLNEDERQTALSIIADALARAKGETKK